MIPLYEKHRPTSLEQMVGQEKAVGIARLQMDRGAVRGGAFWLTGPTGVGKSTLASIMAASVAESWAIREYMAASELSADELRRIDAECQQPLLGKGGRAYVVNEAHGLKGSQIDALNVLLEKSARSGVSSWFFTTTWSGEETLFGNQKQADALVGRCVEIPLTNQGLAKPFAANVRRIAMAEGLDGLPEAAYVKLAAKCGNSHRAMLNAVQSGQMVAA